MNLIHEYQLQQRWRNWEQYFAAIPLTAKDRVIDLGCSVGGVSSLLANRVASVTGIDLNNDFINFCHAHRKYNQHFICNDFIKVNYCDLSPIQGIWASFSLSYLKNPNEFLATLYDALAPGGWIALVDISCFISGNMLPDTMHYQLVRNFELESKKFGVYDFDFGAKMEKLLKLAGLNIVYTDSDVMDEELNFDGAAEPQILLNWQARLARMQGLKNRYPNEYAAICDQVVASLASARHCKNNSVRFVVATKSK